LRSASSHTITPNQIVMRRDAPPIRRSPTYTYTASAAVRFPAVQAGFAWGASLSSSARPLASAPLSCAIAKTLSE
jgi:hypothetical protein